MGEARLTMRVSLVALGIGLAIVICGCGGSSADAGTTSTTASNASAEGSGPDAAATDDSALVKARRQLLWQTIPKLAENPKQACSYLTDQYLKDNYDSAGERGRQRCEREANARKPRHLKSYKIQSSGIDEAKVLIVDSAGSKAVFEFVFHNGKWLLDDATSVHAEAG
jgi:hypothetical protein